jgi:putative aminopeptidase FrvX
MNYQLNEFEALLKRYTDAFGPTSFENDIAEMIREDLKDVAHEFTRCGIGSIIARHDGDGDPRIMLAGHMDEIGFMVKGITSQGYIKVNPLGGWWPHVVLGQKVLIRTRKGDEIVGVFGSKPPHSLKPEERKNVLKLEDMYIDVGVTVEDKDDDDKKKKSYIEELGIQVGDPVMPLTEFHKMGRDGKMLMNKAWDDRIGVAIMVLVMKELAKSGHPNKYFGVGTVQEEVGLRGAGTSAYEVKPDIGFAIDVTLAADIPGSNDSEWGEKLGKGPSISVIDGSLTPNPRLRDFVIDTAKEKDIPYQLGSLSGGGTDGGRIATTASGAPTLTLSIATRYIHSHNGILHSDDVQNLVKLLVEVIKRLDADTVAKIRYQ